MGGLFSRPTAVDLSQYSAELEQIDARIKDLESRKQAFVSSQRSVARSFILYGLFLWVMIALVCLYLIDFPNRNHVLARFMRIGPVMGWPVILFLLKRGVDSYYAIQYRRCDATSAALLKKKHEMVSELENQTIVKTTLQLLQKHSEAKAPQQQPPHSAAPSAVKQPQGLQQQQQQQQRPGGHFSAHPTPETGRLQSRTVPASVFKQMQKQMQQQQQQQSQQFQGPIGMSIVPSSLGRTPPQRGSSGPAPAPSFEDGPPTRSALDKMLDFILNDGPNNKYALICHACAGHNGLVREQDLGKIRFKCALCSVLNGPPMQAQPMGAPNAPNASSLLSPAPTMRAGPSSTPATGHVAAAAAPITPGNFPPLAEDDDEASAAEQRAPADSSSSQQQQSAEEATTRRRKSQRIPSNGAGTQ